MSRPLQDVVIAVTRTAEADDPLAVRLNRAGACVLRWPCLTFGPPADVGPLERAARSLEEFDWVVFTSARAVPPLSVRVQGKMSQVAVAAVGEATAAAAREAGWRVRYSGHGGSFELAERLGKEHDLSGARVLFAAGSLASHRLGEELSGFGARVERVEAYRTLPVRPPADAIRRDLAAGVHFAVFASPSAARAVTDALGGSLAEVTQRCRVVAIGPTSARALREGGATSVDVAATPTMEGLVGAVERILEHEGVIHAG